ncbi:hypothetical protein VNO78_03441 [Psophocarpus tetragonolobus]|uniref:Protein kinase domain-containing protein n=1 Tax=Psophocarpus tetragonolobus TaxID=3891 RepID=A0AAN9T0J1_PSOTE
MKDGGWVKGKLVGYGSFGTVHLAMNKSTGRVFVVKSPHSKAGPEALDEEVKILKTLNSSPYIVQCLGTEEEEQGKVNVFMEYMAGGSLADVARKFGGSLEEEVVRVYTREILLGLKHLHQQGIVHCDVKCRNVLLGSSGNIKLADFGCAKRVKMGESTCTIGFGGTPLWMAPEVLRNESLDFAADIWSLGCTVIEMATGTPPWAHHVFPNPISALLQIAHGDALPHFPPHFSKDGLAFLSRCLHRQPSKRSTAHQLLSHPFVSPQTSSPPSVFQFPSFKDYHLDVSEPNHFSFPSHQDAHGPVCNKCEDTAFGSSGNWINVRSH